MQHDGLGTTSIRGSERLNIGGATYLKVAPPISCLMLTAILKFSQEIILNGAETILHLVFEVVFKGRIILTRQTVC
jgi:hypothetical protein